VCLWVCLYVLFGVLGVLWGVFQNQKQPFQAVEADGGVGNFAKNTTSNVICGAWDKMSNAVGFTSEMLTTNAKSLESDVKKAGGVCMCMCVRSTRERERERE